MLRFLQRKILRPSLALLALGLSTTAAFADSTYGGTDPPPPNPHPVMLQAGTASIDGTDDDGTALLVAAGQIAARLSLI